ncbi:tetratricopeptide repeat protein [Cooperia oncophora]
MSMEAVRLKEAGNVCFREKRYHKAIELYSQSLQKQLSAPVLGNRAQSHLNLEQWPEALVDCNHALELDSKFTKALYRRACALEKMGLKASAVKDLERCLALAPNAAASALKEKLNGQEPLSNGKSTAENDGKDFRFRVPKTHREFLMDYRELQRFPPETFVKYFLAIPTSVYSSLFGELLEADVIGRLLRGFAVLLASDGIEAKAVSTCLLSLSELPRFQLLSMFFGDAEKTG